MGLTEAYDSYADPLYKYCLASLGSQAEAADAVQDTFVIAAARLADLREPDQLGPGCTPWHATSASGSRGLDTPSSHLAQAQFVMAGAPKVDERKPSVPGFAVCSMTQPRA